MSQSGFDFESVRSLFYGAEGVDLKEIVYSCCSFDEAEIDTKKATKQLSEWLLSHSNIYTPTKVILYHGTSAVHPIEEKGLKRTSAKTKKSLQSEPGYVYLSLYPETAKTFGEFAYPGHDIAVYAVEVPVFKLLPDKDQLKNKRLWADGALDSLGNTLAESLFYGSGARVKEDIPPYAIRNISSLLPDRREAEILNNETDGEILLLAECECSDDEKNIHIKI